MLTKADKKIIGLMAKLVKYGERAGAFQTKKEKKELELYKKIIALGKKK